MECIYFVEGWWPFEPMGIALPLCLGSVKNQFLVSGCFRQSCDHFGMTCFPPSVVSSHPCFEAPKSLLKSHGTRETNTATCRMEASRASHMCLRRLRSLRSLHPQTLPDDASNAMRGNARAHDSRTSRTSRSSKDPRSADGDHVVNLTRSYVVT